MAIGCVSESLRGDRMIEVKKEIVEYWPEPEWHLRWRCVLVECPKGIQYGYMGDWSQFHSTFPPPEVRRAAENVWEANRPLSENEWRRPLHGGMYRIEIDGDCARYFYDYVVQSDWHPLSFWEGASNPVAQEICRRIRAAQPKWDKPTWTGKHVLVQKKGHCRYLYDGDWTQFAEQPPDDVRAKAETLWEENRPLEWNETRVFPDPVVRRMVTVDGSWIVLNNGQRVYAIGPHRKAFVQRWKLENAKKVEFEGKLTEMSYTRSNNGSGGNVELALVAGAPPQFIAPARVKVTIEKLDERLEKN